MVTTYSATEEDPIVENDCNMRGQVFEIYEKIVLKYYDENEWELVVYINSIKERDRYHPCVKLLVDYLAQNHCKEKTFSYHIMECRRIAERYFNTHR